MREPETAGGEPTESLRESGGDPAREKRKGSREWGKTWCIFPGSKEDWGALHLLLPKGREWNRLRKNEIVTIDEVESQRIYYIKDPEALVSWLMKYKPYNLLDGFTDIWQDFTL